MDRKAKLEALQNMLKWKLSKSSYAIKLGITVEEVNDMLMELRDNNSISESTGRVTEDTYEVSAYWKTPPTPEQIIEKHKIDNKKWKLSSFWSMEKTKGYFVSALFSAIKKDSEENFTNRFQDFLENYKPSVTVKVDCSEPTTNRKGVLIVNKQDAHLNKLDINGNNNFEERAARIEESTNKLVTQAKLSANIEKIIFIVGSDEFNSEWTQTTTKGTPQQNIMSYEEAFEKICNHNLRLALLLHSHCPNLEIIYIKGNHDEYVGWHMIKWLEATITSLGRKITLDTSQANRKYRRYEKVGLMFNHGDQLKHKELAQIFPMEFRAEWSNCTSFNIFTGDKHHEKTEDIAGIKAYQLPALSGSRSKWDDKRGYSGDATKAEQQVFLIEGQTGNTYIYKEYL